VSFVTAVTATEGPKALLHMGYSPYLIEYALAQLIAFLVQYKLTFVHF